MNLSYTGNRIVELLLTWFSYSIVFLFFVDIPEVPTNVTPSIISSDSTVSVDTSGDLYRSLPDQCIFSQRPSHHIRLKNEGYIKLENKKSKC